MTSTSSDPSRFVHLRNLGYVRTDILSCLLRLESHGATFAVGDEFQLYIRPASLATPADRALLASARFHAVALILYHAPVLPPLEPEPAPAPGPGPAPTPSW